MWVAAYTELVLRVIAAIIFDVYDPYRLLCFPPDVLRFARQLGDDMMTYLGLLRNVRKALELMDVIETSNFELVDFSWKDRSNRATDYHVGRKRPGWDLSLIHI